MIARLRPLVLSGGPAIGKTTTGRSLASTRDQAAFIDTDDVRQLVVAGAVALWKGPAGASQHALAARNTAALTANFLDAGFDVVIADFLTPPTCQIYRSALPQALLVHLRASREEVRRRASTRHVYLTVEEFEHLHDLAEQPLDVDEILDVDLLTPSSQLEAVSEVWQSAS